MAKIVNVTDIPGIPGGPGAPGQLHFDDGRPPLAVLPEIADEHRDRLGLNALDNGVAGPGSGTPDPTGLPPAAPVPPAQPNPALPGSAGSIAKAYDPSEEAHAAQQARLDEYARTGMGPAAAPSPATPAHWSPDSKKVVTEKGPAYDPKMADMRIEAGNNVLDAQMAESNVAKQNAEEAAARATAANAAAQANAAQLQRDNALKQQRYQRQEQDMQSDLTTFTKNNAPDPNHYFKEKGTFVNILSAIAQGLGAAGASLGHTQNFATQITQDAIQRDMAAQEKAYDSGVAGRNTALARFARYYDGDMDLARSALAQSMNRVAETATQQFAAQAQSRTVAAQANTMAAQFKQNQLLEEQKRYELSQGKTTETSEDKFHQASGGGGGAKPLTLDQELAIAKAQQDQKGKGPKDQGALGLTPQAIARQKATYGLKKENLVRFGEALNDEAKLLGVKVDNETGTVLTKDNKPAKPGDLDVPLGVGGSENHVPDAIVSNRAKELRVARINSARLHAKAIYDKSIDEDEGESEANHRLGRNADQMLASLKQRAHELWAQHRETDTTAATIDPRIVNEYNQARKNVNVARDTKTPLAGPTPMLGNPNGSDSDPGDSAP